MALPAPAAGQQQRQDEVAAENHVDSLKQGGGGGGASTAKHLQHLEAPGADCDAQSSTTAPRLQQQQQQQQQQQGSDNSRVSSTGKIASTVNKSRARDNHNNKLERPPEPPTSSIPENEKAAYSKQRNSTASKQNNIPDGRPKEDSDAEFRLKKPQASLPHNRRHRSSSSSSCCSNSKVQPGFRPKLSQELSSAQSTTLGYENNNQPQHHSRHNVVAIDMLSSRREQEAEQHKHHQPRDEEEGKPRGKRKRSRIFFNPSDSFCYWWSAVVSLAFLYNFWSLSYRFAFREIDSSTWHVWFAFDYAADAIYLIDIFVNFRTGYLEDGVLQRDTNKIAAHYRDESTLFYLDSSCLLPFDILYLSFGFCSIFRCNRLVKIHKFWSFVDRTERHTNYPNVFRTFTLVHYILVIFHWNACLFHMISKHKIIDIESLFKINNNQCADIWCQYLHAFYWSTLALTIIGGLPNPRARGEYIYVIVELFFGLFLFASVLGHVANIVTNVSAARKEFQARLDAVKTFMRTRRVSDDLQRKVIRWFDYLWISQKSSDEERSVACLPDRLKAEIAIHVNLDTLKRVDIFQATEAGFLRELVLRLKPVLFSPGDYVCRKDEAGHEMYIVSRGILEVVTNEGQTVVATFRAGSYFGEIAVLNVGSAGNKRTASVRSVGYSDLFCLSKQDLWDVLKDYPNAEARIRAVAEERLSALGGGKKAPAAASANARSAAAAAAGPSRLSASSLMRPAHASPPRSSSQSWRRSSGRGDLGKRTTGHSRREAAAAAAKQEDLSDAGDEGLEQDDRSESGSVAPAQNPRRRVYSSASSQCRTARRANKYQQHQQQRAPNNSYTMEPICDRAPPHMNNGQARLRQATSGCGLPMMANYGGGGGGGGFLCNSYNCACHHHQQNWHRGYWPPPRPQGVTCRHCHAGPPGMHAPERQPGGTASDVVPLHGSYTPIVPMVVNSTQRSSLSSVVGTDANSISTQQLAACAGSGGDQQRRAKHQLSVYGAHYAQQHQRPPPLNIGQSRSFEGTPSRSPGQLPALGYQPDRSRSGALAAAAGAAAGSRGDVAATAAVPLSSSETMTISTPEQSVCGGAGGGGGDSMTTSVLKQAAASLQSNKNEQQQRLLSGGASPPASVLQSPSSQLQAMRRSNSLTPRPDCFDFEFGESLAGHTTTQEQSQEQATTGQAGPLGARSTTMPLDDEITSPSADQRAPGDQRRGQQQQQQQHHHHSRSFR